MEFFKVVESEFALQIEFCAPDSANALSLAVARELKALTKIKSRKPVLVTSGHPRLFCSGGNLSDYKKLKTKSAGLKINREITKALDEFGRWPVPKLALIEGDVVGGGVEWLARFDFRWATPAAALAFWQRRIGLSTGWGGGAAWSRKIGEDRVRQLMLEARLLSANEARREGLVDRIITAWKIRVAALEWARQIGGANGASLVEWTAAREVRLFESLWLGPAHAATLKSWKS